MKTVDKAMTILGLFSIERPEIGLSELARLSGFDKAATRRLLVALGNHNFIEQNSANRQYRLGGGFMRLARIREVSQPVSRISKEITDWLTVETSETAHVSLPGTDMLTTIAHSEPNRGTIVHLDPGEQLPFNATASGIAYLGFSTSKRRRELLAKPQQRYTPGTIIDANEINRLAELAFENGFATSVGGFEEDAYGIAVPFFGPGGDVEGTIAIATPVSRVENQKSEAIKSLLFEASKRLTDAIGGILHSNLINQQKAPEGAE